MNKFLSIVIPRYKETEKDIFPLLSSIAGQLGVDFSRLEIIIANDGGGAGPLDRDFLELFDLEIRQVSLPENRGPGVARQAGLDAARGDYVMFCDADDTLHSVGVLGALIQEAEANVPDILTSEWLEEMANPTGGYTYITHQIENTWMHGKLLRRRFLEQNKIRFHEELRVHEDSYFLSIASALSKRNSHIPVTTYVWKHRFDSITRRNNGIYTFESFPTFIEACCMSHRDIGDRNPELMEYKIVQFALYVYFALQRPEWRMPEHLPYAQASEKMFAEMMGPFWRWWNSAAPETVARIYNEERVKNFAGCVESETVGQWVQRMMGEVEAPDSQ